VKPLVFLGFIAFFGLLAPTFAANTCDLGEGQKTSAENYFLVSRGLDTENGRRLYEAIINYKFIPDANESPDDITAVRNLAETCFRAVGKIPGPDRDELTLRLADSSDGVASPGAVTIRVTSKRRYRDNSAKWSTDASCSVIVHETMHVLGLSDLYRETEYGTAFNCRQDVNDSIMGNDLHTILVASQPFYTEKLSCACVEGTRWLECKRGLDRIVSPPESCPSGSIERRGDGMVIYSDFRAKLDPSTARTLDEVIKPRLKGLRTSSSNYVLYQRNEPRVKSILLPGEFRVVAHPGCERLNRLYYSCIRNAHLTKPKCLDLPECADLRWLTD
jgi:hypothetical protein